MTNAQKTAAEMGYTLPDSPRAGNAMMFDRFAKAAAKSNRPDAKRLAEHYAKRAASQR